MRENVMQKPWLIIVNGVPGAGKTTLAKRLAADLKLPVIHRDEVAEKIFDALDSQTHGRPPMIGPASFEMMYYFASLLLAAGQSLIIEGFFRHAELATGEFLQIKEVHDFLPLQIQCRARGEIVLERFLARMGTPERHIYHRDKAFVENNQDVFTQERLADLALEGTVIDLDITNVRSYDYDGLLQDVRMAINATR